MIDRSNSDARAASAERFRQESDDAEQLRTATQPENSEQTTPNSEENSARAAVSPEAARDGMFLILGGWLISANTHYHGFLYEVICQDPKHEANRNLTQDPLYKQLDTNEALQFLLQLWRRSEYPHEDSFIFAGIPSPIGMEPLNANAMGAAWFLERRARKCSRTKHRYVAQVRALVAAGVAFGLVEVREGASKAKPLHATALCDQLIRRYLTQVLVEITGAIS